MTLSRRAACRLLWAAVACAVVSACASKARVRRAFYAACSLDEDCDSGLCYVGVCSKSCTVSAQCGSGICIENKCKPIAKVSCKTDFDCQVQVPDNGCRETTCKAGACLSQAIATVTVCTAACETGGAKPGACSAGHCIPTQGAAVVACNDDNVCTEDGCNGAKGCTHLPLEGDGCEDGNACTVGDLCVGGACNGGGAAPCPDDGNLCTTEACEPKIGCQSTPNTVKCDDGNPCTSSDGCLAGACTGAANSLPCDDGDPCGVGDLCSAGACKAGPPLDCADTEPCTLDKCVPNWGCMHPADQGAKCDDGDPCTTSDNCSPKGKCAGKLLCTDSNKCTDDACDPKTGCTFLPLTGTSCSEQGTCEIGICKAGTCEYQPKSCDDGNPCTADGCLDWMGVCDSAPITCIADGNPCTSDGCDGQSGCSYPAIGGACDDGNPCTAPDGCQKGACAGFPKSCDDGVVCTADTCDAKAGCVSLPQDGQGCDDKNPCTSTDVCQKGACVGLVQVCSDGNPCTLDTCNPADGLCANTPAAAACDDGDPCTGGDGCANGVCAGAKQVCNDGNPCTVDACNPVTANCESKPTAGPCSDGNPCTTNDACIGGGCSGEAAACNDNNPCTADTCNKANGTCTNAAVAPATPCDDGNPCTSFDICGSGTCTGSPKVCNDGNPCTSDSCVNGNCNVGGVADGAACDDGNPCTIAEACQQGSCGNGKAKCDDGNVCTVESCAGDGTCKSGPNPQPESCVGPQPCGGVGACEGVTCKLQAQCNDSNPCTADACDPIKGCVHTAQGGPCDDGLGCTSGDGCVDGGCKGTPAACSDDNQCTEDTCDPKLGCVGTPKPGKVCDDGNACSSGEVCTSTGLCKGKAAMWTHQYGTGGQSEGRGVAVVGDVAVFAATRSVGGKNLSARVLGHDIEGPKLWDLVIDGPGDDAALAAAAVAGQIVIAGATSADPGGQRDGLFVAVDAAGKKQWQLAQGTGDDEVLLAVAAATDATVVAAGYRDNKATRVPLLMTAGMGGVPGLQVPYALGNVAQARGLAALADGYLLVGDAVQADGKTKGFAVRTGLDGKLVWQQLYGGAFVDSQLVAVLPAAAGFVLAGTTQSAISKPQFWWVATDGTGNLTAQFIYSQTVNGRTLGMVGDATGYMLFGYADFGLGFGEDFLGVRVDPYGNYQYQRTQPLFGNQRVYAGAPLPDGGAMTTGVVPSGATDADILVGRVNPWGILLCGTEGQCGKLLPKDCQDGNPCTADSCIDVKGCVFNGLLDGAKCPLGACSATVCK